MSHGHVAILAQASRCTSKIFFFTAAVLRESSMHLHHMIVGVDRLVLYTLRAGEARLRNAHTWRRLHSSLRGKSPCLGAESVSGKPPGPDDLQMVKLHWLIHCGGLEPFAASQACRECPFGHQPNGAHSPHALFQFTVLVASLASKCSIFRLEVHSMPPDLQ